MNAHKYISLTCLGEFKSCIIPKLNNRWNDKKKLNIKIINKLKK